MPLSDSSHINKQFALNLRIPKLRSEATIVDSGYASADEDELESAPTIGYMASAELEALQADTLERDLSIGWLTRFIATSDEWVYEVPDETDGMDDEATKRERAVDAASTLLASFTEPPVEEEAITRSFKFTLGASKDSAEPAVVEVISNDAPMLEDDHTSVGLQSWGSCVIFGEHMCAHPNLYGMAGDEPIRILELGAGTGLLSIIAAKLLAMRQNASSTSSIVATDFHEDVLRNLALNVEINFPDCRPQPVAVEKLDWSQPCFDGPLNQPFDVILAADVVYHPNHATWIQSCVKQLLSPAGVFWLIVAVRSTGRHEGMAATVESVFPAASGLVHSENRQGQELAIVSKEELGRVNGIGRADEGGYCIFQIRWVS